MSGKKYFYALGQRARSYGWSKGQGEKVFGLDSAQDYARIAYDAGFRGLAI